jgi:hypothetical protein
MVNLWKFYPKDWTPLNCKLISNWFIFWIFNSNSVGNLDFSQKGSLFLSNLYCTMPSFEIFAATEVTFYILQVRECLNVGKWLEFGKRIRRANPFTVRPSPMSNRTEARLGWLSFSSALGCGRRTVHYFPTGRPRFRPADSPTCAASSRPYPPLQSIDEMKMFFSSLLALPSLCSSIRAERAPLLLAAIVDEPCRCASSARSSCVAGDTPSSSKG